MDWSCGERTHINAFITMTKTDYTCTNQNYNNGQNDVRYAGHNLI